MIPKQEGPETATATVLWQDGIELQGNPKQKVAFVQVVCFTPGPAYRQFKECGLLELPSGKYDGKAKTWVRNTILNEREVDPDRRFIVTLVQL